MTPSEALDYIAKIPPTEPVFVLRAKDAFAPSVIMAWSSLVGSPVPKEGSSAMKLASPESLAKSDRARKLAEEMRKWQEENYEAVKIPD
jgi:hypothetical protein